MPDTPLQGAHKAAGAVSLLRGVWEAKKIPALQGAWIDSTGRYAFVPVEHAGPLEFEL